MTLRWVLIEHVKQDNGTVRDRTAILTTGNARVRLMVHGVATSLENASHRLLSALENAQSIDLPEMPGKHHSTLTPAVG
jgi:hypothetical protein